MEVARCGAGVKRSGGSVRVRRAGGSGGGGGDVFGGVGGVVADDDINVFGGGDIVGVGVGGCLFAAN